MSASLDKIEGRYTIVGFNSVGFPIAWHTNIRSVTFNGSEIEIIHKPKGKRQFFKHTYDKLNYTRLYKGWLKENILDMDFISFDKTCLAMFDKHEDKKVFSFQ